MEYVEYQEIVKKVADRFSCTYSAYALSVEIEGTRIDISAHKDGGFLVVDDKPNYVFSIDCDEFEVRTIKYDLESPMHLDNIAFSSPIELFYGVSMLLYKILVLEKPVLLEDFLSKILLHSIRNWRDLYIHICRVNDIEYKLKEGNKISFEGVDICMESSKLCVSGEIDRNFKHASSYELFLNVIQSFSLISSLGGNLENLDIFEEEGDDIGLDEDPTEYGEDENYSGGGSMRGGGGSMRGGSGSDFQGDYFEGEDSFDMDDYDTTDDYEDEGSGDSDFGNDDSIDDEFEEYIED